MTDRRQLNEVSWHENRLGEFHVFGEFGSSGNSVVITLARRHTKESIQRSFRRYKRYLGKTRDEVPVDYSVKK